MHITINGGKPITWARFAADNSYLPAVQLQNIHAELERDGASEFGGGAQATFMLEVAPTPPAFYTVAVYLDDQAYGGPEEGGWWYECGTRISDPSECDLTGADFPKVFTDHDEACAYARDLNDKLNSGANTQRRSDISSVISEGRYSAHVCDGYPEPHYPATRPHYE